MYMFIPIQQGRWKSSGWGSHSEQQCSFDSSTAVEPRRDRRQPGDEGAINQTQGSMRKPCNNTAVYQ